MARPKTVLTEEMLLQRKKSQERIKAYFDYWKGQSPSISHKAIAEAWGINPRTLNNWIHGRSYITRTYAEIFQEKTGGEKKMEAGILADYWMGLTDCKTKAELEEEWKHILFDRNNILVEYMADSDESIDDAIDRWNAPNTDLEEQQRIDAQNAAFFARFGFSYENLILPPSPFEFVGIDDPDYFPEKEYKTYRLASIDDPGLSASFTESELQAVFDRLHDTLHSLIELECYRKAAAHDE